MPDLHSERPQQARSPRSTVRWGTRLTGLSGVVVALAGLAGADDRGGRQKTPTPEPVPSIRFENRQATSGIDFVLHNGTTPDKPIIDAMLGGVAVLDVDDDGLLDVFFTNGANIPSLKKEHARFWNRLYRNAGDGRFTDITESAGVAGEGYSMGVAAADYDNDGRTDLFVAGVNRNILYRNVGKGRFADVTKTAGLGEPATGGKPWSVGAAWTDIDNDGDLDLFVVNYLDWTPVNNRLCGDEGHRLSCSPTHYGKFPNALYRNEGDGKFTDISASSGIAGHLGYGMSVAVADANQDGFTDIFVANDQMRQFLFLNEGGTKFSEVGVEKGVAFNKNGAPVSGMGSDFRDFDNDGRPDIFLTALAGEAFPLFLNTPRGYFVASGHAAGLGFATVPMSGWATGAFDFDGDGSKDLFIANSNVSENISRYSHYAYRQANAVLAGAANGRFTQVPSGAVKALDAARAHRGAAFGDLDNDGRIDVVVSAIGDPPAILFNTSKGGHWIGLLLRGTRSNWDGLGARVKVTSESGKVQHNHATTSVGYNSSSDRRVVFGLATDSKIRSIEIRWPSGTVQTLRDVGVDGYLEVTEPQ